MQSSHNRYKADLFNYATILDQEELPHTLHCLSATTKMLLLSVLDPIAWKTRYIGDADQDTINEWREQAMVQLILDSCGDDLCELIATAIADCTDVQQGIIDLAGQQGWSAGTGDAQKILPVSIREDNLLPDDYTCDDDHRYGMAVGLVEYFHGAVLEVMELIENATNPLELAAEIGDNVPIWELAATGADVILWIQETMYDAYVGAWGDTVKDTIACELYCEMVRTGSCLLSLDVIFDVYNDDSLDPPPASTFPLIDWMVWLFDLELSVPLMIVKIATLMPLLALRYGGKFGSVALGIRSLSTTVELLADDTNEDWDILCDECPEPAWDVDRLDGDGHAGLTIVEQNPSAPCEATWSGTILLGCKTGPNQSANGACQVDITDAVITKATMDIAAKRTRASGGTDSSHIEIDDVAFATHNNGTVRAFTAQLDTGTISETGTILKFEGFARTLTAEDEGYWNITQIHIEGTGTNPFA